VTRGLWGQRPRTVLVRRVDRPIPAWGSFGISSLPHLSLLLMPVGVWMEVELTPVIEQAPKSGDRSGAIAADAAEAPGTGVAALVAGAVQQNHRAPARARCRQA
jgi:hypothetical protein